jgi:hypothetical protein
VLMNRQHSSQQKFIDLLGELKFRAIFLFCNGRDVPWPFFFSNFYKIRNERDVRFDCAFLSVGIPADFLN